MSSIHKSWGEADVISCHSSAIPGICQYAMSPQTFNGVLVSVSIQCRTEVVNSSWQEKWWKRHPLRSRGSGLRRSEAAALSLLVLFCGVILIMVSVPWLVFVPFSKSGSPAFRLMLNQPVFHYYISSLLKSSTCKLRPLAAGHSFHPALLLYVLTLRMLRDVWACNLGLYLFLFKVTEFFRWERG